MQRSAIQTMVNDSLLDGRDMDVDLFGILLNTFKDKIEAYRPWVQLRNEDSTGSITSANTWETLHNLPTRFCAPHPVKRRTGIYSPLVLVSGSSIVPLKEIQWPQRLEYQNTPGYFAINYATGKYSLTGPVDRAYTPYWSFIKYSPSLDADADEWIFPSQHHSILAYGVAIMEKARDYDEVNLENIKLYSPEAAGILSGMVLWDDKLQRSMLGV